MDDKLVEIARCAVLSALDKWARSHFPGRLPFGHEGAMESDLPHLFPAIDAQVARLIDRARKPK
jgi:hypothetical protein